MVNKIDVLNEQVSIESYNWIGSNVTVMKDAEKPDYFVVACNSLVDKDCSGCSNYSIIGGTPTKLI